MGAQAVRLSNVDIDNALKNKDFEVLFQPIFDLGNGALARMESFVRWRHPALGMLPPGAFISFFESQGRMSELTRYVLAEALNAYKSWRGPCGPGFSINLALSDLTDEAFTSHFVKLLRDQQFPADLVTLECPMPAVDIDVDQAALQFAKLNETGARLAIEVRGRANEMLRTIDPFPFDEIKTGGSSILRFARTVRGPGLSAISDLLDIANRANAVITAVGVEDQASLAALRGLGFTAAQGNHLGKVGGIDEFLPTRVNAVRELLDLEALSSESLDALFRTGAPSPKAAEVETLEVIEEKPSDGLVDRLNERVAQEINETEQDPLASLSDDDDTPSAEDEERKAKAREKAKALVLAKRAKARAVRKAAAIARAKAKVANAKEQIEDAASAPEMPAPTVAEPHALQERLNQEFSSGHQPQATLHSEAKPIVETVEAPTQQSPTEAQKPIADKVSAQDDVEQKLSVPEKVAATMGANPTMPSPAMRKPKTTENAPATLKKPRTLKMAVGDVHAYFQPGISVGGPAFDPRLETSATRAAEALNAAMAAASPPPPPTTLDVGTQAPPETQSVSLQQDAPVPQDDEEADLSQLTDDAESAVPSSTNTAIGSSERRPRKRKGFLARTVFPYPTHFWPKPWKRSYQRWTSKRAPDTTVQAAE